MTADHAQEGLSDDEWQPVCTKIGKHTMDDCDHARSEVDRILASRSAALRAERDALRERVEALADEQQRAGDRLIEKNQDRRSPAAQQRWTEGYSLRRSAARLRALLADPSEA